MKLMILGEWYTGKTTLVARLWGKDVKNIVTISQLLALTLVSGTLAHKFESKPSLLAFGTLKGRKGITPHTSVS